MKCACTVPMDIGSNRSILIEVRTPKAIKCHSCYECNRLIYPGEEYRREILKQGTDFFHHKYCEDCLSVREVFFSQGWYYEMLWEQMTDFIAHADGDISVACLKMLTKKARDKILDLMQEYWDAEYDM